MYGLEENQISAISRFFSSTVIQEMARHGKSPLLARLAIESGLLELADDTYTLCHLFNTGFDILKKKQMRHEYIYKAALTHRVLLGKHSLKTASLLSEFRVGKCKADIVILNGTGTVYEIKSERDTLSRLTKQIESYMTVFAKVNVIVGENHIDSVMQMVPEEVGILKLTGVRILGPVECSDFPLKLKAGESRNEEEPFYRRADRQSFAGCGNRWQEGCGPAA